MRDRQKIEEKKQTFNQSPYYPGIPILRGYGLSLPLSLSRPTAGGGGKLAKLHRR